MTDAIYATLGPRDTNHDRVLQRYLARGRLGARIVYAPNAFEVLDLCIQEDATHMMICAAHPAAAEIVAKAQYNHGLYLVDTFIAESEALAIICRKETVSPRDIALHPATRHYADLTGFDEVIEVDSTVAAFEGMLKGQWESALTQSRFLATGDLRSIHPIEAARDAWLILSRK